MQPLEGIRVLDFSDMAPGPYCTMLLGDMGADVLKISAPAAPPPSSSTYDVTAAARLRAHDALNRNKRSVVLNLKMPEAVEVCHRLVRDADVVVTESRPGVPERLHIGYAELSALNPRLVYCAITGFGQEGPYSQVPAHDINYIAIAGALGMIGLPGGPPVAPGNLLADFAGGGMQAVIGILLALMARERTGKGQLVDISMTDGVLQLLTWAASSYFATGEVPERGRTHVTGADPDYGVYRTKDGKYVSIAMGQPKFWLNFCRAVGREDLIPARGKEPGTVEDVRAALEGIFATRTRDEWFEMAKEMDTCIAPVYSLDEALRDPQVRHRRMVEEIEAPGIGKVQQIGVSVKLSETPGSIRSLAPSPGQDTDDVLAGLGYTPGQIASLRRSGAIA